MRKLSIVALLCCVFTAQIFAQSSNATVSGTVSDSTGALIPGVTITATNTQTGIVSTVLSNESGTYDFASLQPGSYNLSAELSGSDSHLFGGSTRPFSAGSVEFYAAGRRCGTVS